MARTPKTSNPSDEREAKRRAVSGLRRKKQERYWHDRAQSRVRANDHGADAVKAEHERAYKAGLTHMLEAHRDYLVKMFDNEDDIIDGLFHLLNTPQVDSTLERRHRKHHKKGDSAARIDYKGHWHGKDISMGIGIDIEDRICGINEYN